MTFSKQSVEKVMKSPKVAAGVQAKAAKVQEFWKSVAPVFGDRPPHRSAPAYGAPGDYRGSIHVTDKGGDEGPRARVGASDFKAKWIEFGTKHMPEYAPKAKVLAKFRK